MITTAGKCDICGMIVGSGCVHICGGTPAGHTGTTFTYPVPCPNCAALQAALDDALARLRVEKSLNTLTEERLERTMTSLEERLKYLERRVVGDRRDD